MVFVVVAKVRLRVTDPLMDTAISLVTPFAAYLVAEELHASGVISVVVAGLLLGHKAPVLQTAQSRIAERINWRTIAFLLENTVFLLIGLQAALDPRGRRGQRALRRAHRRRVRGGADDHGGAAAGLGVRGALPAGPARPDPDSGELPPWQYSFVLGWAGMRGVVTLAAAFVIPEDTEHREVLLLIAFTVVAGTLFLQGLTLPWLARRLRVPSPDPLDDALARASVLQQASKAGLRGARADGDRRPARRPRPDPAAGRAAQLRRLGAAGHDRRAGVAQRPLRAGQGGHDRRRAGAGARDPQHGHRGQRRHP